MVVAALDYAARLRWPVFPLTWIVEGQCSCGGECDSPGKHPLTKQGFKDATTDLVRIREWWSRWPKANIGVPTGAVSGVIALDVDPRHGGNVSLEELEREHGPLPTTPVQLTGGGGRHYLFAHPGGHVPSPKGIRPGLDVQADGAYIVVAPSLHISGRRYEWEASARPGDVPLAPLNGVIPPNSARQRKTAEPLPDVVSEGGRNQILASLAGSMRRRGATPEAIAAALKVENTTRCDPPLPESEVESIARSVGRYDPAPSGPTQGPEPPREPGEDEADPWGEPGPGGNHEPIHRVSGRPPDEAEYERTAAPYPTFGLAETRGVQIAEREMLFPGLDVSRRGLIVAPSETGKTWVMLELALKAAAGGKVFSQYQLRRPYRVLLIAEEDEQQDIQIRLRCLADGNRITEADLGDRLHIISGTGFWFGDPAARDRLFTTAALVKPDLILFDTISQVSDIKQFKDAEDVIRFYRQHVRPLREEHGCGVHFSHHTNKLAYGFQQAADDAAQIHGSDAFRRIVDTVVFVKPARDKRGIPPGGSGFVISTNKQRVGRRRGPGQFLVALYPEQSAIAVDLPDEETPVQLIHLRDMTPDDAERTTRRPVIADKVEQALRSASEPLTYHRLQEITGAKERSVKDSVKKLCDQVEEGEASSGRVKQKTFTWKGDRG